uniref:Transposase n=1 Tax=Steinernema glaseri TaxID=37863 RepID=A0A1I8ALG6_9BILA
MNDKGIVNLSARYSNAFIDHGRRASSQRCLKSTEMQTRKTKSSSPSPTLAPRLMNRKRTGELRKSLRESESVSVLEPNAERTVGPHMSLLWEWIADLRPHTSSPFIGGRTPSLRLMIEVFYLLSRTGAVLGMHKNIAEKGFFLPSCRPGLLTDALVKETRN